ncbi:MAG: DUF1648 domain-containing protein [Weeksellaceae bacterium]|nr:DUF1648 domain-containing protein [Bacteroidota bacterium]MCG2779570.1 DUF1648 domain-containing protein [Weeksellaceae bacterium]
MSKVSFFLKVISVCILVFTWIFTVLNFGNLPETIPVHYDFAGNPDGFGSKHTLWLLNGLMTAMFLFLFYVSKKPDFPLLNIPQNLKDDPATADLVVAVLMIFAMSLLGNISYESMLNALGKTSGIGTTTNYLLGVIFIFIIGMLMYSWRLSQKKGSEEQSPFEH